MQEDDIADLPSQLDELFAPLYLVKMRPESGVFSWICVGRIRRSQAQSRAREQSFGMCGEVLCNHIDPLRTDIRSTATGFYIREDWDYEESLLR